VFSLSLVSRFYRAVFLSIILHSSATRPKNTLLTPAVLHPANSRHKHVCWDTHSLSLSDTLCWWHKQCQPPWSVFQLEEDEQICFFLSVTSNVAKIKPTSGQLPNPGPQIYISALWDMSPLAWGDPNMAVLFNLQTLCSQQASYNALMHKIRYISSQWLLSLSSVY